MSLSREEQFALSLAREVIDAEDNRKMGHTATSITLARALVALHEKKNEKGFVVDGKLMPFEEMKAAK